MATGILQDQDLSRQDESLTGSSSFPSARNPQNKRESLVIAATRLFAARGYRSTTTRDIATAAGCAEGLIHRYFHGKLGLLQAVLEAHALRDSAGFESELPTAATLEDEVMQLMSWLVDRIGRDTDIYRITLGCSISEEKPGVSHLRVLPAGSRGIEARLRAHRLPETSVRALSQALQAMALSFGLVYPAALGYDRHEAKQLALSAAAMLCEGVVRVEIETQTIGGFASRQAFSND